MAAKEEGDKKQKGCIEYAGPIDHEGYGRIYVNGKRFRSHRYAWELKNGKIENGLCVLHKCDNRICWNVEHLFLGTRTENSIDKVLKDRQAKAEKNGTSKLTSDFVREARIKRGEGWTWKKLSERFFVDKFTIRSACLRHTWRSVV